MSDRNLSPSEALHNSFFYFVEALSVLAADARQQSEAMGGDSVAWELQHDVLEFGEAVRDCAAGFLGQAEQEEIARLLREVRSLPPSALSGSNEEAMNRPEWSQLRSDAMHLMSRLAGAIAANRAYFQS